MMTDNILRITFKDKTEITTRPLYQYDYGQVLKVLDVALPLSYEVHFSNYKNGIAITNLGDVDGVNIPDELLQTGLPIYAWIYLHTGENDGETEYDITIPVNKRAQPSNATPSQVQQDIITQTLAALSSATNSVAASASAVALSEQIVTDAKNVAVACASSAEAAWNQISESVQLGYITIGATRLTETDLQKLLRLVSNDDQHLWPSEPRD